MHCRRKIGNIKHIRICTRRRARASLVQEIPIDGHLVAVCSVPGKSAGHNISLAVPLYDQAAAAPGVIHKLPRRTRRLWM